MCTMIPTMVRQTVDTALATGKMAGIVNTVDQQLQGWLTSGTMFEARISTLIRWGRGLSLLGVAVGILSSDK